MSQSIGCGMDDRGIWVLFPHRIWAHSVPQSLSVGVNEMGREVDYSPQSRFNVRMSWRYTSIPEQT
jgi:hypothetical protein